MPKISVIVPVYNVELYINRCVNSILNQSFTDFEMILVDDGSPDNCGAICDEYAEKDNRTVVIHKENGGLSSARNAGLDVAAGEYILFVDSDDYLESDLLETLVQNIVDHFTVVSFGYSFEDEKEKVITEYLDHISNTVLDNKKVLLKLMCNELTDYRLSWCAWSKLYSRFVIEKYNIRFADNRKIYAEDLYFNLCYFPYVKCVKTINRAMYHYIGRGDSITGKDELQSNISRFEQLAFSVKEYYSKHNECNYLSKYYDLIYYKIMLHAVIKTKRLFSGINEYEIRELLIKELSDFSLFKSLMRTIWQKRKWFYNTYYDKDKVKTYLNEFSFYSDGNHRKFILRDMLINDNIYNVLKSTCIKYIKR